MSFSETHFGQSELPILMDNVHCIGNESRLVDCAHRRNDDDCIDHLEQAGARCLPRELININIWPMYS